MSELYKVYMRETTNQPDPQINGFGLNGVTGSSVVMADYEAKPHGTDFYQTLDTAIGRTTELTFISISVAETRPMTPALTCLPSLGPF
jgi:hypothetical protein